MTDLDRILLVRAEEQLAARAWKRADRGESKLPTPPCERCGGPCRSGSIVCATCRSEGWRGGRCACGALLHKRDYPGAKVKRAAACGKCRAEARMGKTGIVKLIAQLEYARFVPCQNSAVSYRGEGANS